MRIPLILAILCCTACQKEMPPAEPGPPVEYLIRAGQQFADNNQVVAFESGELKFRVRFDSSAVYSTTVPENQFDINKLYGFSDNNSQHHQFSARFGWRWSDGKLSLHAYIYNNGIRTSKEISAVEIGKEHHCSIQVKKGWYVFRLNGKSVTMPRAATTEKGSGYRLYPYFGGDELAPHDIHIFIRELK